MSTQTKRKTKKADKTASSIVWFEIPADKPERAKKFYAALFGWNINLFPQMKDYWHIETGGDDATPDGGLMARKCPEQKCITNYINVASVEKSAKQVQKLGGKVLMPK